MSTRIRRLFSMYPFVYDLIPLVLESLVAIKTLIRFLFGVNIFMDSSGFCQRKTFTTIFTLICFLFVFMRDITVWLLYVFVRDITAWFLYVFVRDITLWFLYVFVRDITVWFLFVFMRDITTWFLYVFLRDITVWCLYVFVRDFTVWFLYVFVRDITAWFLYVFVRDITLWFLYGFVRDFTVWFLYVFVRDITTWFLYVFVLDDYRLGEDLFTRIQLMNDSLFQLCWFGITRFGVGAYLISHGCPAESGSPHKFGKICLKHLVVVPIREYPHLVSFHMTAITRSVVVESLSAILAHLWQQVHAHLTFCLK